MTVEELIELLKTLPQHYMVITKKGIYEGADRIVDGIDFVGGAKILITAHIAEDK